MRKILLALVVLLLVSAAAAYYYFDHKFTPPPNQLKLSSHQDTLAIKWVSNKDSEYAALLLPVRLKGIPETFYMQFDLGSHSTLLHEKAIQSINKKYPNFYFSFDKENESFDFSLGQISVSILDLTRINYGKQIKWEASAINIIGTLGSDILEHKVVTMNFKDHFIYFSNNFPNEIGSEFIQDFDFKKRKVLLNGKVNNESTQLYYDSGSSAFELITDKEQWEKLAIAGAKVELYQANSWGKMLEVHTIASNGVIQFGGQVIPLQAVTHIEGTSFVQNLLMYFSGMGGMIGNKLFLDRILVLDARNQKFTVVN